MIKTIYTKEHSELVKRLKEARLASDLSQIEASKKLGKSQSYVSKIETGQLRVDIVQLKELAKAYKKDINFFIE
jgi:transcriptional regulator with XRE-family HTH domain